jgi:hypothetical protein
MIPPEIIEIADLIHPRWREEFRNMPGTEVTVNDFVLAAAINLYGKGYRKQDNTVGGGWDGT